MKAWLKEQTKEVTAWTGLVLILGAFLFPRSLFVFIGIALIAIDDKKASAWVARISPWAQRKIDES